MNEEYAWVLWCLTKEGHFKIIRVYTDTPDDDGVSIKGARDKQLLEDQESERRYYLERHKLED